MYETIVNEMDKIAQKLINNAPLESFTFEMSNLFRGKKVKSWERSVAFYYNWAKTFEMAIGYDPHSQLDRET
jgi:hypothetical protein